MKLYKAPWAEASWSKIDVDDDNNDDDVDVDDDDDDDDRLCKGFEKKQYESSKQQMCPNKGRSARSCCCRLCYSTSLKPGG